jgi:L-amino acid N-acyltransferase YncA
MKIFIKPMRLEDWPSVRAIYEEGIAGRMATFETSAPEWADWDLNHLPACRLVAWQTGEDECQPIVGWAALSPISRRKVYAGVAEVSIYIAVRARGQGLGRALLTELITQSEQAGIWTLQATILAENSASLALHRSAGFREMGRRERIAQLDGIWRDTVVLERRSKLVGI